MISIGVEDKLTLAGSMFSKTAMTGIPFFIRQAWTRQDEKLTLLPSTEADGARLEK